MNKNTWIISTAILFTLMWFTPAWSVDQTQGGSSMPMPCPKMEHNMGGGMGASKGMGMMHGKGMMGGGGMMHGKKAGCPGCPKAKGMMGGKGMMQGKGMGMMQGKGMGMMHGKGRCPHCPMGKKGRMGMGGGLMREFHHWMKQFMAHRSLFDMSSKQMNQLDSIIMEHMKNAIQNKADIRVAKVELRQMLRQTPMDLSAVENQLNRLSSLKAGFQMEGIRLYSNLLSMLSDQQKEKVDEIIGSPFPAPWEKMFPESDAPESDAPDSDDSPMEMENPHEGHHMEGSGMETETEPGEMKMKPGDDSESAT